VEGETKVSENKAAAENAKRSRSFAEKTGNGKKEEYGCTGETGK
jgi:hypothetical protein